MATRIRGRQVRDLCRIFPTDIGYGAVLQRRRVLSFRRI